MSERESERVKERERERERERVSELCLSSGNRIDEAFYCETL